MQGMHGMPTLGATFMA